MAIKQFIEEQARINPIFQKEKAKRGQRKQSTQKTQQSV